MLISAAYIDHVYCRTRKKYDSYIAIKVRHTSCPCRELNKQSVGTINATVSRPLFGQQFHSKAIQIGGFLFEHIWHKFISQQTDLVTDGFQKENNPLALSPISCGLGAYPYSWEVRLQQVLDERRLASRVLPDKHHHGPRVKIRILKNRGVEVVKLILLLEREQLLPVDNMHFVFVSKGFKVWRKTLEVNLVT